MQHFFSFSWSSQARLVLEWFQSGYLTFPLEGAVLESVTIGGVLLKSIISDLQWAILQIQDLVMTDQVKANPFFNHPRIWISETISNYPMLDTLHSISGYLNYSRQKTKWDDMDFFLDIYCGLLGWLSGLVHWETNEQASQSRLSIVL